MYRPDAAVAKEEEQSGEIFPAVSKTKGSVAVLPFADMSPAKDQDYFCDGITEEIINSLAG